MTNFRKAVVMGVLGVLVTVFSSGSLGKEVCKSCYWPEGTCSTKVDLAQNQTCANGSRVMGVRWTHKTCKNFPGAQTGSFDANTTKAIYDNRNCFIRP